MENNKYQNGKIYKIVDIGYNKCYIGSTIETLSNRMAKHRYSYKASHLTKTNRYETSIKLFDEYGIENCKIELIETYPCNSKDELVAREGFYIKSTDRINKKIEGRTMAEYRVDNKDKIKDNDSKYREEHKEELKAKKKAYYENNKEVLKDKSLKYYQVHQDECTEKRKTYYENNKEKFRQLSKAYREKHKEELKEKAKLYYQNKNI